MIKRLPNGRWQARHRPVPGGQQVARNFDRKLDATRWLDEQKAAVLTGQYVDPRAGRVTFREYAEAWRAAQVHRPSTVANLESLLRRHAYPRFGDRPLASIRPSEVQAWAKGLALAPATVGVVHAAMSSIMKAAVRDRILVSNPCEGTKLPRQQRAPVVPMTLEQVEAVRAGTPHHLQALVTLGAGTGMRPSELTGLTVDRLHMLRREVVVDQQLVTLTGQPPQLGPPKTQASVRTVPLPHAVVDALAAHLAEYEPGDLGVVFCDHLGRPLSRRAVSRVWAPLMASVGLAPRTGLHALRHFYASLLIRHGESVKVVQARLGHATAAETLDTYAHLWPDSDDRTREAVDRVLSVRAEDSLRTEGGR